MSKDLVKLLLIGGAIAFAVMFGMELASSGIRDVYGPLDQTGAGVAERATSPSPSPSPVREDSENGRYGSEPDGISVDSTDGKVDAVIPRDDHMPVIDQLANKTAEMLQHASKGGIHFVVDLFSKTTE